jgi:F-type H+-transporting ATPase subunit b
LRRSVLQAALLGLLAISLAGFASPRLVRANDSGTATKGESSELPHELLYKTINFLILVGGLSYVLRKPLAEFFAGRTASIQKGLDEGRTALEASQARLRAVEEKLRGQEAEIAEFKASAAREMAAESQRLERTTAEEAERILESARAQTSAAVRSAGLELKKYVAQKAVAMAEELIRARLDDAARQRLVTQFVTNLETNERKN